MRLDSLILVTAAAVTLASAGCGRHTTGSAGGVSNPRSSKPTIGVSLLTMSNPFFKEMGDAMKAEAAKHGYEVVLTAGENDAARQKDQVKDFIVKKVAAIVLCPCDSHTVGTTIAEANAAGIPVFTADIANLDKTGKVVCHIATDNYGGGKLAAQAMIDILGGKGKVAIIDHPEVESVILRTRGFHEVIDKAQGIKVVAQLPGQGERDTAYKAAQDILEKNPDLDGIFAINDPSALGAVAALEKAGRQDRVKVIGFDGMPEAKQAIKQGRIYADAVQFPNRIGMLTVDTIAKYMAGEKVPSQVLIPTSIYTKADASKDPSLR